MVDHGADAATVVANAATDITKGVMQISASGLKQLFLLMYEGQQLKIGETNIEKLIKMIDAGDSINDITVPKEQITKFVDLSQKHGVTYAVVENPDGKMIVYFPESQANRMQNVVKDIQNEINLASEKSSQGVDIDNQNSARSSKNEKGLDLNKEKENPELLKIKKSLYTDNVDSKKTVVFFDGKTPNHYVRASQEPLKNGGCETRCYVKYDDGITELATLEKATLESYNYENRMHFEVDGLYPESKVEEHINKVCNDIKKQDMAKEIIREKENVIDNIIAKNSSLEGSIHTIYDSNNRNNMIVVYKQLKPFEGGEFKTVNRIMVFSDGKVTKEISPKQAILSYEKYKTMEKKGKSANKQYEKIMSGEFFKNKNKAKEADENNIIPERKSLVEYEKEVEKIKELEPKKPEIKEALSQSPEKIVKDTMARGER